MRALLTFLPSPSLQNILFLQIPLFLFELLWFFTLPKLDKMEPIFDPWVFFPPSRTVKFHLCFFSQSFVNQDFYKKNSLGVAKWRLGEENLPLFI